MSDIRYYTDGTQATAANLNKPLEDLNKQGQYISKAEFDNLAEMRRNAYAGSGFIEWGKHHPSAVVNEGFWMANTPNETYKNRIFFARSTSSGGTGSSNTEEPIINVNGSIIKFVGTTPGIHGSSLILPEASSPEIITDSVNIQAMKQGDFAILNDMSKINFEENFDNDLNGFGPRYTQESEISYNDTDHRAELEFTANYSGSSIIQKGLEIDLIPGIKYVFEMRTGVIAGNNSVRPLIWIRNSSDKAIGADGIQLKLVADDLWRIEFSVSSQVGKLLIACTPNNQSAGDKYYFDNIKITQSKAQPLVCRNKFAGGDIYDNILSFQGEEEISNTVVAFMETWTEKISDKDFVYPLGNVQNQYGSGAQGDFTGADTYSLSGSWQEAGEIIGTGSKWSTMTNEEKLIFASNKENNIYKDGNDIYQLRYRVRIVKGYSDKWYNTLADGTSAAFSYNNSYGKFGRVAVQAQGITPVGGQDFHGMDYNCYKGNKLGAFFEVYGNHDDARALPMLMVQRKNDGAFDPIHNPQGCNTFSDGKKWFETADSRNSMIDCFLNKGTNGYIDSGISGRPDNIFCDGVDIKEIQDLRMSALKVNKKEIMDKYANKFLSGSLRGDKGQIKYKKYNTRLSLRGTANNNVEYSPNPFNNWNYSVRLFIADLPDLNTNYNRRNKGLIQGDGGRWYSYNYAEKFGSSYILYLDTDYGDVRNDFVGNDTDTINFSRPVVIVYSEGQIKSSGVELSTDIITNLNEISKRVKYTVIDGTTQTVDLKVNDYVLNSDGKYYRSLVERDTIDLDTDDFTSVTNWFNLGSDGSKGSIPEEFIAKGYCNSKIIRTFADSKSKNLVDISYAGDGHSIIFSIDKKITSLKEVLVLDKNGKFIPFVLTGNPDNTGKVGILHSDRSNTVRINIVDSFSSLGYDSEQEMRDLSTILVTYYNKVNPLVNSATKKMLETSEGVKATNSFRSNEMGGDIISHFIDKVGVNSSHPVADLVNFTKIGSIYPAGGYLNDYSKEYTPTHEKINLHYSNPAVKFFNYLTEYADVGYLVFVYKELVWDYNYDNAGEFTDILEADVHDLGINTHINITDGKFSGYYVSKINTAASLTSDAWNLDRDGNIIWDNGEVYYEKWSGNGFGDDDKFQIKTYGYNKDDNDNAALIGQKSFRLPYFLKD